jgi:hypothetical protein
MSKQTTKKVRPTCHVTCYQTGNKDLFLHMKPQKDKTIRKERFPSNKQGCGRHFLQDFCDCGGENPKSKKEKMNECIYYEDEDGYSICDSSCLVHNPKPDLPSKGGKADWSKELEKIINRHSNTSELDGEAYPLYGIFEDVKSFISNLLKEVREEQLKAFEEMIGEDERPLQKNVLNIIKI